MTIDYTRLANEINTDPRGYGYAPFVANGNDGAIVELLTRIRNGTDGTPKITVSRAQVPSTEILENIDVRDFRTQGTGINNGTLAASWFESVTQSPQVKLANPDGTPTRTRANIDLIVSDTNGSQTRLNAVAVRAGSRAEEMFGVNTYITGTDVSFALRGTS
jgi:hypothetical protein